MAMLIKMPLATYRGFMGRCLLESREYEILKNSAIGHIPEFVRDGNVVEFFCTVDDAKLLLTRARSFFPDAAAFIEEGLNGDEFVR